MNIFTVPINNLSFSDVAQFCEEGLIEGVQLDYKRELPLKGLAKHFASFSNTRGGLLIIGVQEDAKTGRPVAWEGINYESKLVDKIHQYATCVEPRPLYEIHVTNEVQGKEFILIRVFEGDRTPYYVQNDANLYIRTGNITDPIDLASPEAAELLFTKKAKAELARNNHIFRSFEYFEAATRQAEKQRQKAKANEKDQHAQAQTTGLQDSLRLGYSEEPLGTNNSLFTILLQPFFPKSALTFPQELLSKAGQYRASNRFGESYPEQNLWPIQDGVLSYQWRHSSSIICQQIYATGLLYDASDVLRVKENGQRTIYFATIASRLLILLKAATTFYQLFEYQGGLKGFLRLENVENVVIYPIIPSGYRLDPFFFEDHQGTLLSKYEWEMDLDTSILTDEKNRRSFFIEKIQEMNWSLGYQDIKQVIIDKFLEENKC